MGFATLRFRDPVVAVRGKWTSREYAECPSPSTGSGRVSLPTRGRSRVTGLVTGHGYQAGCVTGPG